MLGFGHILDHRVSYTQHGSSLGTPLGSVTLAPRQTKRITSVRSRIVDAARRTESQRAEDTVAQSTTRTREIVDDVRAALNEWARGGSSSCTASGAAGFGFAASGFVIGGGAATAGARSDSWENGGRSIAASEQQRLSDGIRQFGESTRKAESMVVFEQTQEEFVEAVSEVIRNPNYCHALTIVYHEILEHRPDWRARKPMRLRRSRPLPTLRRISATRPPRSSLRRSRRMQTPPKRPTRRLPPCNGRPYFPISPFGAGDAAAFEGIKTSNSYHLCIGLLDLTDPWNWRYAGDNDHEMLFTGSMMKVVALCAAFALRNRVQRFVERRPSD